MSGHLPGLCLANEAGPNAPLIDAVVEAWPGRQGTEHFTTHKVFDTHRVTKLSKGLTSFAVLFRSFLSVFTVQFGDPGVQYHLNYLNLWK